MTLQTPFFIFNPKSYLYGEALLHFGQVAEQAAQKYPDVQVMMSAPYSDLAALKKETEHVLVTAQHMDPLYPGRGMGHVLPEALYAAGARACFLNHAEKPMLFHDLVLAIERCKVLGIESIVCADSLAEAKALAKLQPSCILCEPTELIGTGETSDAAYIEHTNAAIRSVSSDILVMQGAGISSPEDVYRTIRLGADGTGCTSGILKAAAPERMFMEMVAAVSKAAKKA